VGKVGEYVSSLPVVISATLVSSYLVAMLVTPIMCAWLLVPIEDATGDAEVSGPLLIYDRIIVWSLDHKPAVLGIAGSAFLASLTLIPIIGSQFFPSGDRDQFFIKIWLPEGSPIAKTSNIAKRVERILVELSPIDDGGEKRQRLANVISFIGTGGPRLMITQEPEYDYPYFAFLLVNTTDPKYTQNLAKEVSARLADIHEARITTDLFMLGPPIRDPVAFRLSGQDSDVLRKQARKMVRIFKHTPGIIEPYSNWGATGYEVELKIDADAANLAGVTNADVALSHQS